MCIRDRSLSGHQIFRMSALQMVDWALGEELLADLKDGECANPKCEQQAHGKGAGRRKQLGALRAREDVHEVEVRTACYRCVHCRRPVSALKDSPVFSMRDHLEEA
eukprot:7271561-Karenia_brevis.AAC.1